MLMLPASAGANPHWPPPISLSVQNVPLSGLSVEISCWVAYFGVWGGEPPVNWTPAPTSCTLPRLYSVRLGRTQTAVSWSAPSGCPHTFAATARTPPKHGEVLTVNSCGGETPAGTAYESSPSGEPFVSTGVNGSVKSC